MVEKLLMTVDRKQKFLLHLYLLAVIVSILFFLRKGDDIAFHLQRLDAIMQEFRNKGISALPIRIYHASAYGYGYASPMFYGDIFMWPFAALGVLLKLSVVLTYKIMLAVTVISVWLMADFSFGLILERQSKDLAVFLYMVSVTVFGDMVGSCVGRDFALMFVPLCLCSLYGLIYSEKEYPWRYGILLALGVAGLLYSNVLDAAITVFSLAIIFAFLIRKVTLDKFITVIAAAFLCIALSAWFVLPMVEQMASQTFFVTSAEVTYGINGLDGWTMPLVGLLLPAKTATILYKLCGWEIDFPGAYFYGMLYFLALVGILFWKRKKVYEKQDGGFYIVISILLLVFMLFQTKLFPHQAFAKLINTMQFPWRVNIVMTCIACLLAVRVFQVTGNNTITSALAVLSATLVLISCINSYGVSLARAVVKNVPYADYSYSSDSLGCGEYLPLELLEGTDRFIWKDRLQARGDAVLCEDNAVKYDFEKSFDSITVNYSENNNGAGFEFPLLYYKGYAAVDSISGTIYPVEKNSDGLVCVKTDEESGTIRVFYEGTSVQKASEWCSVISTVLLLSGVLLQRKRRKGMKTYETFSDRSVL